LTPTGTLDVLLGETVLYSTSAVEHLWNTFERVTISVPAPASVAQEFVPVEIASAQAEMFSKGLVLIPSDDGAAVRRLRFRFDGPAGSRLLLDSIVFPGLRNGEFNQFDEGWFWEGPGRLELVATIREDRWTELVRALDSSPPVVTCVSGDHFWHSDDVSLACTAQDEGAGLADLSDASFTLATSVPAGTETASASTDSRQVCDVAGNCSNAGPLAGNMVDKKAPVASIVSPEVSAVFTLGQPVAANYVCQDAGSGVASCVGDVSSGSTIGTGAVGSFDFVVNAADNLGNKSSTASAYVVSYGVCPLYDITKAVNSGATLPIKLQLCDVAGINVSAAGIAVTTTGVTRVSDDSSGPVADSGRANPDFGFRYDATLGGYIYNLSTKGLSSGTYRLNFKAGSDPQSHEVLFKVR
jgi:hypothetical protein